MIILKHILFAIATITAFCLIPYPKMNAAVMFMLLLVWWAWAMDTMEE